MLPPQLLGVQGESAIPRSHGTFPKLGIPFEGGCKGCVYIYIYVYVCM